MKSGLPMVMLLLLSHVASAAPADDPRIIVVTKKRPVVIQLRTLIDGRPARAAREIHWKKYVQHLLGRLDADRDGALNEKEAQGLPTPANLAPGGDVPSGSPPVNVAFSFFLVDTNGDGKVTADELSDYYGGDGGGTVHVRSLTVPRMAMEGMSRRLMTLLDTDGDNRLSQNELAAASKILAKWDRNEDELLTLEELPVTVSGTIPIHVAAPWGADDAGFSNSFVLLHSEQSKRARPDLAKLPVDVEATIRFGKRAADQPPVTLKAKASDKLPSDFLIEVTNDEVLRIHAGDAFLELRRRAGRAQASTSDRPTYLDAFKKADANGNGSLSRAESRQFFPNLFELLDENGDDQVGPEELISYLDKTRVLQASHLTSRLALLTSDKCDGLMGLLDKNRDGRLSLREAQQLTPALLKWDRDRNGLSPDELPRSYQMAIGLGQVGLDWSRPEATRWHPAGYPMLRLDWAHGDLSWFYKMDRNRDGDVSVREFLGPLKVFQGLDTDRDGLLSVREASAFP